MAKHVDSLFHRRWLKKMSLRQHTLVVITMMSLVLLGIVLMGFLSSAEQLQTHLTRRNLAPSWGHLFGTDWLGRDMFVRTIKGLQSSLKIGLFASLISVIIATLFGVGAAVLGKVADRFISWLIDLFLAVPHLLTIILIAVSLGGGSHAIIIGIAVTHWTSLARVVRAEVMQLRSAEYVQVARRLGRTRWWIATRHLFPHLFPQILIGSVLLFPHAILHEAAVTFLGFGLSPHQPAIGVILAESMQYLSAGMWWLAFFPGLSLLMMVFAFERIGTHLRMLLDPYYAHQ